MNVLALLTGKGVCIVMPLVMLNNGEKNLKSFIPKIIIIIIITSTYQYKLNLFY